MCFIEHPDRTWNCINCGAGDSVYEMQDWAAREIKRGACWWGRQHQPDDGYKEIIKELKMLRSMQTEFHGRSVSRIQDGQGDKWQVRQELTPGSSVTVWVSAGSSEEALEKTKAELPYVTCDHPEHVTIKP